jgi:hypothetical protein
VVLFKSLQEVAERQNKSANIQHEHQLKNRSTPNISKL